jgi:hypothetical protein
MLYLSTHTGSFHLADASVCFFSMIHFNVRYLLFTFFTWYSHLTISRVPNAESLLLMSFVFVFAIDDISFSLTVCDIFCFKMFWYFFYINTFFFSFFFALTLFVFRFFPFFLICYQQWIIVTSSVAHIIYIYRTF